jgi:hypothetical protein
MWSIPAISEIMLRPKGQRLASALLRRLDGRNTYCGARLEHDAGQDRYPSCLKKTEGCGGWLAEVVVIERNVGQVVENVGSVWSLSLDARPE